MKKQNLFSIPKYARFPLIFTAALYLLAYNLPKLINLGILPFVPKTPLDSVIPLWEPAVFVYVLAYFQWIESLLIIAKQPKRVCYPLFSAASLALLLSLATLLFFPTTVARPELSDSLSGKLLGLIYMLDKPINLFPSFHCVASWFCVRGLHRCEGIPKGVKVFNLIFTLMVFASTLLTKQHLFVDVPAGVLYIEMGFLLSKKWKLDPIYDRLSA